MLGIDLWTTPSAVIAQHYNHLFRAWKQGSGFIEEEEARRASVEFHLAQNLKPKRRRRPVPNSAERNQTLLTDCNDDVQVITARLKLVEVDMQAHACFSSPPPTLDTLPLAFNPWARPESPAKRPHPSGFPPQPVRHWTAPNWYEGVVESSDVAGDLAEPLLTEPFEYPYEGCGRDLPNFYAAFESLSRNAELINEATFELAQTPPTQEVAHAFSTFAWTQDATSPKMLVNPRYLSRSKHTRVDSAAISPRTMKRLCVPEPIATGSVALVPLAIRTAQTIGGDDLMLTHMNGPTPEAPDPLNAFEPHEIGGVEGMEVYTYHRSHSAVSEEQFRYGLEVQEREQRRAQAVPLHTGLF